MRIVAAVYRTWMPVDADPQAWSQDALTSPPFRGALHVAARGRSSCFAHLRPERQAAVGVGERVRPVRRAPSRFPEHFGRPIHDVRPSRRHLAQRLQGK
jgi:hypothetical protein